MIDELLLQHCLQFTPKKFPGLFCPLNINQAQEEKKGRRMDEGAIGVTSLSTEISVTDEIASAPLLDPKQAQGKDRSCRVKHKHWVCAHEDSNRVEGSM